MVNQVDWRELSLVASAAAPILPGLRVAQPQRRASDSLLCVWSSRSLLCAPAGLEALTTVAGRMLGPRLLSAPIRPWEVQPSPGGTQVTALHRPVDLRRAPSPEKIIAFPVHLSWSGILCSIFTLNLREKERPPGSPADVPAAGTREGPPSSYNERTFTDSHLT